MSTSPGSPIWDLSSQQKRLEVLLSALPNIAAVAVLLNPANPATNAYWQTTEEAARSFGLLSVARVEAESIKALLALRPTAFTGASAVVVMQDGLFWNHRRDVLALVNSAQLPAVYAEREYADDGGLIAHGPNISDNFRRAASYVDRILKAPNPATCRSRSRSSSISSSTSRLRRNSA